MAEHLTPSGRAGIIVPEGIIFQGQTAYTQLRKMLVEEFLVAVVSLPAGVFNPYSGVKTSILILDKSLAKKADTIAFFKIENDGFGLGAQRRPMDKNDLLQARAEIAEYLRRLRSGESVEGLQPTLGLIVEKEKVAANGDYNLSGERYRENGRPQTTFPFATIKEVALEIKAGFASGQSSTDTQGVPHIRPMNITEKGQFTWDGVKSISEEEFVAKEDYSFEAGDVLFNNTNSKELVGKTCLINQPIRGGFSNHMTRIRANPDRCVPHFLALLLHNAWQKGLFLERANKWIGQAGINAKSLSEFEVPLPPLEVQKKIVAEIDGYQKVIDGARAVLNNYRPHIPIHPDWPEMELGKICRFIDYRGKTPEKTTSGIPLITAKNVRDGFIDPEPHEFIAEADYDSWMTRGIPQVGDVLFTTEAPLGNAAEITSTNRFAFAQRLIALSPNRELLIGGFLKDVLLSKRMRERIFAHQSGTTVYGIKASVLKEIKIPVPPLTTQQQVVAEIEAEQALVAANRELLERFEDKIQATLARVWGEDEPSPAEA